MTPLARRFLSEIQEAAQAHRLQPALVEAVVQQESSYETRAYRYEEGFWTRYMAKDPRYASLDPHRFSASYGLMQVMWLVAVEVGFSYQDPEYLLVPSIGLEFGCRKLRQLLDWAGESEVQALAAYNGGRGGNSRPPYHNVGYANAVLQRRALLLSSSPASRLA
jgi:soluble lytic murein transglycosylase-like protein